MEYRKTKKRARNKSLKLAQVTWCDAWQSSGWSDDDDDPGDNEPEICHSFGLVKHDTKRGITLSGAIGPSKTKVGWGHKQFIPRGMIIEVRIIEKIKIDHENLK